MVIEVITENSKSRSGLHKRRRLYFIVTRDCRFREVAPVRKDKAVPTYAVGEAEKHFLEVSDDAFIVVADFRINWRGKIRGDIELRSPSGEIIARGVYRKLKVRLVEARAEGVIDLIKCLFKRLKLPVKKYGIIS